MRPKLLAGFFIAMLAAGGDSGFAPRAKPSDYPVHGSVKAAVVAAVIVPPDQVRKMFSADIGKGYVVVEVAVYPQDGGSFDVVTADFSLKVSGQVNRPENPRGVAIPWGGSGGPSVSNRGPTVTEDTGVIVAHGPGTTGRPRTAVATYEGVGVSNAPRPADPTPAPRGPDPTAMEAKLRDKALPEGVTSKPVAGYLYFPQYGKKRQADSVTLTHSADDMPVDLRFPK
jgi:hypothetical protein